jgi:hypothetical protein
MELTIQQSIRLAKDVSPPLTRTNLVSAISEKMYLTLCRLGILTEGATVDDNNNRVAVAKWTDRANLFDAVLTPPPSPERERIANALMSIGF